MSRWGREGQRRARKNGEILAKGEREVTEECVNFTLYFVYKVCFMYTYSLPNMKMGKIAKSIVEITKFH